MTKGRMTTQEERAQNIAFRLAQGKNYGLTVETYQVSYQQISSWVRKYETSGVEGLIDLRGRGLTETERRCQENRMLQAKLKDKKMEIALLKN